MIRSALSLPAIQLWSKISIHLIHCFYFSVSLLPVRLLHKVSLVEIEKSEFVFAFSNLISFSVENSGTEVTLQPCMFVFVAFIYSKFCSLFIVLSSTQCLQSSEACDSLSVDNIMAMMMNTKTSTKPLVVVDAVGQPGTTGIPILNSNRKHKMHVGHKSSLHLMN